MECVVQGIIGTQVFSSLKLQPLHLPTIIQKLLRLSHPCVNILHRSCFCRNRVYQPGLFLLLLLPQHLLYPTVEVQLCNPVVRSLKKLKENSQFWATDHFCCHYFYRSPMTFAAAIPRLTVV